ncbi:all trans-polyprenyl-diphosphate synthase PDSS1-like [Paramacrobiotus metropolitanus]|uniref:all trans-polyprenyl-diphosphate synthase PDSS1-like n=1 Tax=Paramacrobiotus metropolitanus TaxID=2943436 RepID=UPI002445F61F|nr:all trans-polyprenyl-diphosphate synthase PDSS1-like [Paramacrobiotus metropolitanus]
MVRSAILLNLLRYPRRSLTHHPCRRFSRLCAPALCGVHPQSSPSSLPLRKTPVRFLTAFPEPTPPVPPDIATLASQTGQHSFPSPYELVGDDLAAIYEEIRTELQCDLPDLVDLARYYFTAQGKAFRPMVVLLMAAACGRHNADYCDAVAHKQRKVAIIAEMIHTASLIHDDVIDEADTRRNKPSLHYISSSKKAVLTGDYILSVASRELARLRHPDVIICLAQVIEDLVKGELMQLGSTDAGQSATARFAAYLSKTYHKTASLLANSCKAVAMLGGCSAEVVEASFQFGKNLGMAFQLVDDNLDYVSTDSQMGKPTSVDLKLGLATAPVLLAAQTAPELNALIERRFRQDNDVELARKSVFQEKGVEQAKVLAAKYSQEAVLQLTALCRSPEQEALVKVAEMVLTRSN